LKLVQRPGNLKQQIPKNKRITKINYQTIYNTGWSSSQQYPGVTQNPCRHDSHKNDHECHNLNHTYRRSDCCRSGYHPCYASWFHPLKTIYNTPRMTNFCANIQYSFSPIKPQPQSVVIRKIKEAKLRQIPSNTITKPSIKASA